MKKKNVMDIRYSRAIRLWSTVSSHERMPYLIEVVLAFGRNYCASHGYCTFNSCGFLECGLGGILNSLPGCDAPSDFM